MTQRTAVVLLALLVTACTPAPNQVAIDGCLLREYLAECGSEEATPEEDAACRKRAPAEATRVLAAVPQQCRPPGL